MHIDMIIAHNRPNFHQILTNMSPEQCQVCLFSSKIKWISKKFEAIQVYKKTRKICPVVKEKYTTFVPLKMDRTYLVTGYLPP